MINNQTVDIELKYNHFLVSYFSRPGRGPNTILYLHGAACAKEDFFGSVDEDSLRGYTIAAFDFPGCGDTPYIPEHPLDLVDLVAITGQFVQKLSLPRFIIVGHSMGGIVALLFTLRNLDKIKGFISVEGNLSPENCVFSRKIASDEKEDFVSHGYKEFYEKLSRSDNAGMRAWATTMKERSSPYALADYCPSIVEHSDHGGLLEKYAHLTIPKLYVYGTENKSFVMLQSLREQGYGLAEIPGSNHFPMHDNPKEFYKTISSFCERIK